MREIISLHVGQCGNQLGSCVWKKVSQEHQIDPCGKYVGVNPETDLKYINVFFQESSAQKYVPRALLIDTEPSAIDVIQTNKFKSFYNPDNIITDNHGAGNCWTQGYEAGSSASGIGDKSYEVVRKEMETCDSIQGFQMTHSTGGGTGSGFGSWMFETLRDDFPDVILTSYSIVPGNISSVIVEPYNSALCLNTLQEDVDGVYLIDNEAIARLCSENLGIEQPLFEDYNDLISETILGLTASLRYPGQHNTSLRKQLTNLVPKPEYHLFLLGQAPLCASKKQTFRTGSPLELATELFSPDNMMLMNQNPKCEKILAACACFRGNVATREIDAAISMLHKRQPDRFVSYLNNCIQTSICNIPPPGLKLSATCVVNSSAISDLLLKMFRQTEMLMHEKAFSHIFCNSSSLTFECIEAAIHNVELAYTRYAQLTTAAPQAAHPKRPRLMESQDDDDSECSAGLSTNKPGYFANVGSVQTTQSSLSNDDYSNL